MTLASLILTHFTVEYKAENLEKKHRRMMRFAAIMHDLRIQYSALLSDIKGGMYSKYQISEKRTQLEKIENIIYSGIVPYTSKKAVVDAAIALKIQ